MFSDNFAILLYDQRGCGNNMSDYVTLGMRESVDLENIVLELFSNYGQINIFLWGRQMGAVAIIHYLHYLEIQRLAFKYDIGKK